MATIKDIAERVGVTSAAVSRVLNYDQTMSVSDETKEAIFRVAKELDYQKKKIYPPIENVVVLSWAESAEKLEDEFYSDLSKEVIRQAKKRNMQVTEIKKWQGIQTVPKETQVFVGIGRFYREEVEYLKKITKQGIFIDSSPDEEMYDSVRPNIELIVSKMVTYFVNKGHKEIGFIGINDIDIDTKQPLMDEREWVFRKTLEYFNLSEEHKVFIANDSTVEEGYRVGKECAEVLKDNLPTAFCISSDTLAIGFLQAMNELGIAMPERVAVFSINDLDICKYVSPPLSTYHVDIPVTCETALNLLHERIIKKRSITKTVYINGKPIYRKSC